MFSGCVFLLNCRWVLAKVQVATLGLISTVIFVSNNKLYIKPIFVYLNDHLCCAATAKQEGIAYEEFSTSVTKHSNGSERRKGSVKEAGLQKERRSQ